MQRHAPEITVCLELERTDHDNSDSSLESDTAVEPKWKLKNGDRIAELFELCQMPD